MSAQLEQNAVVETAAAAVTSTPETFKVKVHDLHSEDRFEYAASTMEEAITLYKRVIAAGRETEPRPFVYLDDAHWLAQVKYSGGLVRQVWICDSTGKVRGHNAGMRRREAAKQNPVALPPSITPVAKPVAQSAQADVSTPVPVVTGEAQPVSTENIPF